MYEPALGRWHVVDPLADNYYSLSPYNYVAGNPINYIDPDGCSIDDYGANPNGLDVEFINETDDPHDVVYIAEVDENGEVVRDSDGKMIKSDINGDGEVAKDDGHIVNDETLLPELATRKTSRNGYGIRFATSDSREEISGLFLFFADNTNVEWSIMGFYKGSNRIRERSEFVISTYGVDYAAPSPGEMDIRRRYRYFGIHSHAKDNDSWGASPGDHDYYTQEKRIYDQNGIKTPYFGVYEKHNKSLYQYTDTKNKFIRSINGDPSRFFFGAY